MDPRDFLKTIYLHDRGCTGLLIDCERDRVSLQIDLISRIRSSSGDWEFDSDEDIDKGLITFTGVESLRITPGPLPNDYIYDFTVEPLPIAENGGNGIPRYIFRMETGSVNRKGDFHGVTIEVVAAGVHLQDPARPGLEIHE